MENETQIDSQHKVVYYYDRKSWWAYVSDLDGNQLAPAEFAHDKLQSIISAVRTFDFIRKNDG